MSIFSSSFDKKALPSETQIVISLAQFLSGEGYKVRFEVPNLGQSIDLVATRNRYVTAIEAKRFDWRRAIRQCRTHELVADYVCIALFADSISDSLRRDTAEAGYGLLWFEPSIERFQWVIQPRRNEKLWLPRRRTFAKNMRDIEYAVS